MLTTGKIWREASITHRRSCHRGRDYRTPVSAIKKARNLSVGAEQSGIEFFVSHVPGSFSNTVRRRKKYQNSSFGHRLMYKVIFKSLENWIMKQSTKFA